jgi:hypothetical protein
MPTEEEITDQHDLLATYRRTLSRYLKQLAQHGEVHAPPSLFEGIRETRDQIKRIKAGLRMWQVAVDDHPNDVETLDAAVNMLYIISDMPNIKRFEPYLTAPPYRTMPSSSREKDPVGAVDGERLHNYLLPIDCPRVTFYALPTSTPEDIERFMGLSSAKYIVAVESRWIARIQQERLYRYDVPSDTFTRVGTGSGGHWHSQVAVVPLAVTLIDNLLTALVAHDVELRVLPSLWQLHDAVMPSTLHHSMIRLRNAIRRKP